MANSRSALALISICILVSLSGLGDCRVPLQREEQLVSGVEEEEQSVHLLLPSEKEEFKEIAREIQPLNLPLERSDLRGNDRIFHGERRGFRFGRPGGCHHGKFNRRGPRMSAHMRFPLKFLDLQAEARDFHTQMDRPFPEKRDFGPGFQKGEWRHPGGEKRGREHEHMPFPRRGWLEILLHPFSRHDHRDFHPRMDRAFPEKRHFDPGFPEGEWRHPEGERRGEENEHMPFPARGGWLEFFFHPFLRHDGPPEFHPREDEFRREFGHGFPRADEFHPRRDEFRRDFGHSFPRMDKFHPRGDEFKPEFDHGFPRGDEFRPREDEFRPEFGHGFPNGGERRHHRDEIGDNEQMSFPEEQDGSFPHGFLLQPESEEFHSRVEKFKPLSHEIEFEPGFPGREGRQPRHGHGEEEKEIERTEVPLQAESTEFRSGEEEFQQYRGPFKTE